VTDRTREAMSLRCLRVVGRVGCSGGGGGEGSGESADGIGEDGKTDGENAEVGSAHLLRFIVTGSAGPVDNFDIKSRLDPVSL
jgi:hypothetical protein